MDGKGFRFDGCAVEAGIFGHFIKVELESECAFDLDREVTKHEICPIVVFIIL